MTRLLALSLMPIVLVSRVTMAVVETVLDARDVLCGPSA